MVKQIVTDFRQIPGVDDDVEVKAAVKVRADRLMRRWRDLEKNVRDRLVPVQHSVTVERIAG